VKYLTSILWLVAGMALAGESAVELEREGLVLHGTLLASDSIGTLVILHPGSGPTDRNGNQTGMTNNSLRMLAEALYGKDIAALRYDKRGVGGSRSDQPEGEIRPSHYVDDLAAWAEWGRARGFEKVHLLGHSEGALFAKAAAQQVAVDSVISLAGAGRTIGIVLREQTEGRRPGDIGVQFERVLSELEAGRQVEDVPQILHSLFRPSVQPYMIEWLAMDPEGLAVDLDAPLLVVGGSTDLQVGRGDFEALAPHAEKAAWIKGMNHVLKAADGPIEEQLVSYTSPDLPLHEELVPLLVEWLDPE
jgi:uncharacterized protein